MVWLQRIGVLLLAVAAAGVGVSLHVADHFTDTAKDGVANAQRRALEWYPNHAVAQRIDAVLRLPDFTQETSAARVADALQGFRQAIKDSPLEVRAMARIASTDALSEATDSASPQLAALADRLAPVMPQVQRNLTAWALTSGQLDKAMSHVARTLLGEPSAGATLFPLIRSLMDDEAALGVLGSVAQDPRRYRWWLSFVRYLATDPEGLDALRTVVKLRDESSVWPLQADERAYYIGRLRKDGFIDEAYLYWVNGLDADQMLRLGYLYDGGFDQPFDNSPGFGWHASISPRTGIIISRSDTYGSSNDASLRVSFSGKRVRFRHVYQHLMLPPGQYRLSGRVRPDQLEGRLGVGWVLSCDSGDTDLSYRSEPWLGTGEWRDFWFDILIPETCPSQILRLESVGSREVDHELQGTLWLDDLQIELFQ
jgi:hypothetical protein